MQYNLKIEHFCQHLDRNGQILVLLSYWVDVYLVIGDSGLVFRRISYIFSSQYTLYIHVQVAQTSYMYL